MISRLSGIQDIHCHNYTRTTREGYISSKLKPIWLEYNPSFEVNTFTGLYPGLYGFNINNKKYIFILHEDLSFFGELCIKNESNIFSIQNIIRHNITPYLLHDQPLRDDNGQYTLSNTVNGHLDVLILKGNGTYSTLHTHTSSDDGRSEDKTLDLKLNLLSVGPAYDILYLDADKNIATFESNVELVTLSGYENFQEIQQTEEHILYRYPYSIANNSNISCSDDKIKALYNEYDDSIILKVSKSEFPYTERFIEYIKSQMDYGSPINITYQCKYPTYIQMILDDYYINTFYNSCTLECNNLLGLCYKHFYL